MALTICPATGCDSFIGLVDAEQVITDYTLYGDQWSALTDEDQERYLRIAYRLIVDNAAIPDPIPDCLPQAQALIAANDMFYGISSSQITTTGSTKKEKVGQLEVEYFEPNQPIRKPIIPTLAKGCLESIGWYMSTMIGVKQTTLGRS